MFQLRKILVPVDFSANSAIAVSQAAALARRFHSEITLIHANECAEASAGSGPLGYGITSTEVQRDEQTARCRARLDEFATAELADVHANRIVVAADAADAIVHRSREEHFDLIVMPTRGNGRFRRFLLGSVAAKVLHDAECPVWTGAHCVNAAFRDPADIRRVLCAVNFGQQSSAALRWAAGLASALGAGLTVAHAVLDTPPNLPERYMFQWHEEAHWGAEERLRTLLNDAGVAGEVLVISDADIPKAIASAAAEHDAGLVVVGRSCAAGAARPLGSHTYAIICHAPCPVVSV